MTYPPNVVGIIMRIISLKVTLTAGFSDYFTNIKQGFRHMVQSSWGFETLFRF